MRRRWRWLALAAAAGLAGTVGAVVPTPEVLAQAGDCWEQVWVITGHDQDGNPVYGWRFVDTCQTSDDETPDGGGPAACRHSTRGEVPCHDPVWGWWSNAEQCYASRLDPQPPAGDPLWEGNDPADGAIYQSRCPGDILGPGSVADSWTVHRGFRTEAPGLPSVVQVAQQAMERLELRGAEIGIAPTPDGVGLVGLPVWLWTNNAAVTWGPVSVSVPGPGITVAAEATATQIEWDMGDGHVVVCDGPGVPYRANFGADEPDCGHWYSSPSRNQPDGRYHIAATTIWRVEWWVEPRGTGAEGEDYHLRESTTSIQINELQVVTS